MNKIMLMGRLTQEPEMRSTAAGKSICNFRLAVKRKFVKAGEQEDADFFPITAWEKIGEFCNTYFKKGQQVVVIGRVQNRTWTDEQGNKRMVTEVIAEDVYFADSKKDSASSGELLQKENSDDGFRGMEDTELPF